ncbi:hypothetical protein CCUS01_00654 [Colletotrichum cuscutae]|uniref:Uncharacterized protein n=1 Tax=Colletotrichum cuscutae TaxID=1209917 RepID=A0AAI9VAT0_9PEZI|nr:hypothetical protein CCUS01_00654 [Colletotrichum cuscutae]
MNVRPRENYRSLRQLIASGSESVDQDRDSRARAPREHAINDPCKEMLGRAQQRKGGGAGIQLASRVPVADRRCDAPDWDSRGASAAAACCRTSNFSGRRDPRYPALQLVLRRGRGAKGATLAKANWLSDPITGCATLSYAQCLEFGQEGEEARITVFDKALEISWSNWQISGNHSQFLWSARELLHVRISLRRAGGATGERRPHPKSNSIQLNLVFQKLNQLRHMVRPAK